jgi:cbb3-type cytochrome oxidase subunit 3
MTRHAMSQWLVATGFLLLLGITFWAFLPGTGGHFIFDDEPNLQLWSTLGDIDSLHKLLTFTFSSKFFPGRPLSLLSFVIDDQGWPADVITLKRTNLAIHLLNTCLVYWLSLRLMRHLLPAKETLIAAVALASTAVWALHPIQVSNVDYIIQRMNLLETTLALAALLLFSIGRDRLQREPTAALLLCSAAIGLLMPLAILTKENGLLICAYALLIEAFCYQDPGPRVWRLWKVVFLWLPLLAFVAYCVVTYHGFTTGFESRNFTAWQRLLTEGPVVLDYLHKLLLPHMRGSGLFFDNFPVSQSLLEPATLASWILLTALLAAALLMRRRIPLFSFGILFYFCGHLMESTVLPLELYFEHRNYLPQMGLWLALASLLTLPAMRRLRPVLVAFCCLWLVVLTAMTRNNAALWSQPTLQAAVWYRDNPGSARNILTYANALISQRQAALAEEVLTRGQQQNPASLSIAIAAQGLRCYGENLPTSFDDLPALARTADYETGAVTMLEATRKLVHQPAVPGGCTPMSEQQIAATYIALLQNPHFRYDASSLMDFLAEMALDEKDPVTAAGYYLTAFRRGGSPIDGFHAANLLARMGQPERAHAIAVEARRRVDWRLRLQHADLLPLLDAIIRETDPAGTGAVHR